MVHREHLWQDNPIAFKRRTRLAALMIEYGVGVTTRQTRTSQALDSNYFLEE